MDTSALIDLGERRYPERIPVFQSIWQFLYSGIDDGTIISVDAVHAELSQHTEESWRKPFLQKANQMFRASLSIEEHYARVIMELEQIPELGENNRKKRFLSGADPWVIALSRSIGAKKTAVVSSELKRLQDYGLGAICNRLKVRHLNLLEFFDENKVGLV